MKTILNCIFVALGSLGLRVEAQTSNPSVPIYVGAYSVDHEFSIVTDECMKVLRTKKILLGSRSWGLGLGSAMGRVDKKYEVNWESFHAKGYVSAANMFLPADLFAGPKVVQYTLDTSKNRWLYMDDFLRKDPWKFGEKIDGCLQLLYTVGDKNMEDYFPILDALIRDYPNVKFAVCTHHVNASGMDLRGNEQKEDSAWNIYGGAYSDQVLARYYGKVAIFDLRDIASTRPDGTVCSFESNGKTYRKMCPEYNTNKDMLHLNSPDGSKRLPKGFLILLTKMFCADLIPKTLVTPKPVQLK